MDSKSVVKCLSALAHESRLMIYRQLIQAGQSGLNAGKISELTAMAPNSVSFHMKELVHAGLVTSRQEGRYVIYTALFDEMNHLIQYLTENCCSGDNCSVPQCLC